MFHVRRHDPRVVVKQENNDGINVSTNSNPKKRSYQQRSEQSVVSSMPEKSNEGTIKKSTSKLPSSSSFRIIAENQSNNPSMVHKKGNEFNRRGVSLFNEAFDDLGIDVDSLLEESRKISSSFDNVVMEDKEEMTVVVDENESNSRLDLSQPTIRELKQAKKLSNMPLEDAIQRWKLAPFLIQNLLRDGFHKLFPIQCLVIPDVISSDRHSNIRVQDVCVTAPTGTYLTFNIIYLYVFIL
jgi:hypothetical protein